MAALLEWCVLYLASYPSLKEKLMEATSNPSYATAAVEEILRHSPGTY